MTSKEAGKILTAFLDDLLNPLGFRRIEGQRYGRPENDANAQLSFPWQLAASGNGAFTAWVGLRFESLAPWLDGDGSVATPTTVVPIHLLHDDKNPADWRFSNADDLENLRELILGDLRQHALPFIERYSRIGELRKALESSDNKDWIGVGLNVDTRVTTLAAIQLIQGDRAGAVKTLDDALKALDESLAGKPHELRKRRFEIAYLRNRLA